MNDNQVYLEPEDCWLSYDVSLKEEYRTGDHPSLPVRGLVTADLIDPDVFCVITVEGTGSATRMLQEHKKFYEKEEYQSGYASFISKFMEFEIFETKEDKPPQKE